MVVGRPSLSTLPLASSSSVDSPPLSARERRIAHGWSSVKESAGLALAAPAVAAAPPGIMRASDADRWWKWEADSEHTE
jgi:hypothetical protein